MRNVFVCSLLSLVLAGCAHMGTDAPKSATNSVPTTHAGPASVSRPASLTAEVNASAAADTTELTAGNVDRDGSSADLAEPLEKEVTQAPCPTDGSSAESLTPEEARALETEPEIHFELDIKETDILKDYFVYYSKKKHHVFQRWLKRAESYLPYIRKVFTDKGLPQDLIFLPFAESGFNPLAYSHAGAAGMWQFIPSTGRMYGLDVTWWMDERRDPYLATEAAASYLKRLYQKFEDWYLVLAAYNAGEGHVSRAMRRNGSSNYFDLASNRRLHRETCRYVPKFLAVLKIVRNLETLGFESLSWDAPEQPTYVTSKPGTNLRTMARALGMSWDDFHELNPAFRRTAAPPNEQARIYVPATKLAAAEKFIASSKATASRAAQRYRIRSGDSWWRLSQRFDVPMSVLKQFNQTRSNLLRPGQWVLIPGRASEQAQQARSQGHYTVKSGDSLWTIARSLGTTVQALQQANPNISTQHLSIGRKLQLPGQAQTRRIASRRSNYTVQSGDTLWGISRKFDLSLSSLLKANGLSRNKTLHVGDKLYIPDITQAEQQLAQQSATKAHQRTIRYQVRKGDNVWSIARKFGVPAKKLLSWNELSAQDLIHPGDTLTIFVQ